MVGGINRLGKGPARPGTIKVEDPHSNLTIDCFSEKDAQDPDYLRTVRELEESNAKDFLFLRGAFDKGDLLYLRDQEERQRHMELEQKESETMTFARLRAKAEAAATAQPPTLAPPKPPAVKKTGGVVVKPVVNLKAPKVKAVPKAKQAPAAKRPKPASEPASTNVAAAAATTQASQPTSATAPVQEGLPGLLGGYGSSDDSDA